MVARGLADSRSQAQRLIMAGLVRVDDQIVPKPSTKFPIDANVTLASQPRYVSRGGEKLQAAFEEFNLQVEGLVCADVGASTGGFSNKKES